MITREAARTAPVILGADAVVEVIAPVLGPVAPAAGPPLEADKTYKTAASVFYDAVFVPGGAAAVAALEGNGDVLHFLQEAYKHCKTIAAIGDAINLLVAAELDEPTVAGDEDARTERAAKVVSDHGVVTAASAGERSCATTTAVRAGAPVGATVGRAR